MKLNPKLVVCIVYVMAMFMVSMDGTIVNVILPSISQEFNVIPSATSGINVGYLVSLAVFLPISGWLGDRYGTKKIFLLALGVFTVASLLCGFAKNFEALTLFRALQGAGGGLLTPVGMAILFRTFSQKERLKVSRTLILPIAFAPAIGPVVGGFFADKLSWSWAFYINIPFGIVAFLIGLLYLKEHKESAAGRLDLLGFLLSAVGLSMLMYALSTGPSTGWGSSIIMYMGSIGFILVCLFVWWELRVKEPMLDVRLLSDRLFRSLSLISLLCQAALLGMLFVFPLMYQNAMNASALDSGLATFPEALGLMVASRMIPWTFKRLHGQQVICLGLLGTALIFTVISIVGPTANPWFLRLLLFSVGIFLGHAVIAVQSSIFTNITSASMGRATTLFNVQNRVGSAVGVAILASVLGVLGTNETTNGVERINLASYQVALLGSVVFLIIGLIISLSLKKEDFKSILPNHKSVETSETEPVRMSK